MRISATSGDSPITCAAPNGPSNTVLPRRSISSDILIAAAPIPAQRPRFHARSAPPLSRHIRHAPLLQQTRCSSPALPHKEQSPRTMNVAGPRPAAPFRFFQPHSPPRPSSPAVPFLPPPPNASRSRETPPDPARESVSELAIVHCSNQSPSGPPASSHLQRSSRQ